MNETENKNNFALVPKTSGAVEKAAPGAKRVLAGMVADTLALTKKVQPFKIIHVDDEDWLLEMVGMAIRAKFKNVVIVTFQNGNKAWEELSRADPDLLITDLLNNNIPGRTESFGMNGYELLPLLAKKNVKYPILVLSGSLSREGYEFRTRQIAGPNLNVSLLKKPITSEQLYAELAKHIKF